MRRMTGVRRQLRGVAGELTGVFFELEHLARSLGTRAAERSLADLEDEPSPPSPATELRTAVLCGMHDHLRPLIESLLAASGCGPEEIARATPALPAELLLPKRLAAGVKEGEDQEGAP